MELKDTIEMMNSEDYQERFKAEYYQAKIRMQKLEKILVLYELNKLEYTPKSPHGLLCEQYDAMRHYVGILRKRAILEDIDVGD